MTTDSQNSVTGLFLMFESLFLNIKLQNHKYYTKISVTKYFLNINLLGRIRSVK